MSLAERLERARTRVRRWRENLSDEQRLRARERHKEHCRRYRARQRLEDGTLPPLHIVETVAPPDFLGLPLLELERGQCRYPRGEGSEIRFCGQPVVPGQSWCGYCCTIVYRLRVAA